MTASGDGKLPRRFGVSPTAGHEVQAMDEAQEAYFREGPSLYREYTSVSFTNELAGGCDTLGLLRVGADGKSSSEDESPFLQFTYNINAGFDAGEPSVCEGSDDLVLYMPAFRAAAHISVAPMTSRDSTWKIGWVMACSRYRVRIHYGSRIGPDDFRHGGTALWECPYINMSCSDEVSMPWHDLRSVTPEIKADSRTQPFEVVMASLRENVFKPVPLHLSSDNAKLDAYYLKSDEEYFTWLVAENTKSHSYFVMKTLVWSRKYRLPIATLYPKGSKSLREFKLVKGLSDKKNWPLPEWALRYPFLSQDVSCKFYPAARSGKPPRYLSGCQCKIPYYVPVRNYELVWKDERIKPSLHEKDIELVQSFYGVASVKGSLPSHQ